MDAEDFVLRLFKRLQENEDFLEKPDTEQWKIAIEEGKKIRLEEEIENNRKTC